MKVKRIVSAIALSFFLAGCGVAKGTTHHSAWPSVSPTLVVLGDSVSAGQYLPSNDDAYPRLLATDLHARLTVYAVPGHTTAQTHSMMKFNDQGRYCHAERSEASVSPSSETLRCAQGDKTLPMLVTTQVRDCRGC